MLGALAKRVLSSATALTASGRIPAAAAAANPLRAHAGAGAGAGAGAVRPMVAVSMRRGLSTEAGGGDVPLDALEKPKPPRNSLVGMVVSDKMDKSIVVRVSRIKLFLPYMVRKRTFKKIMAHDEENACGIGDIVRIKPSRPLSKRKAFTLHEILRKDPKLSLQQQQQQQQQAGGSASGKAASAAAAASS